MKTLYPDLHEKFAMIIEAARSGEEGFFTNSSGAATDILKLLDKEDRIKAKVVPLVFPQVMVM